MTKMVTLGQFVSFFFLTHFIFPFKFPLMPILFNTKIGTKFAYYKIACKRQKISALGRKKGGF